MTPEAPKKSNRLTLFIISGMVAGVITGIFINSHYTGINIPVPDKVLDPFTILADIFLRLIKMIVAPLVFTTLVVGVAKQGHIKTVGRVGGKTLLWFLCGSFTSLFLGMVLVNFFKPGEGLNWPIPAVAAGTTAHAAQSLRDFIGHIFPKSIFEAMAQNEILQVVVFSLFLGWLRVRWVKKQI